jgi:pyrroline-5-carboxylate reductase
MQIGLIGAGNMARALARGWGEPVICSDAGSGRARQLVAELGGTVCDSNREVAERCELVVLCHKPAQLQAVADQIAPVARAVASVLAATHPSALRSAYPAVPTFSLMPNTPVEVRKGVICYARAPGAPVDASLEARVLERFALLGDVVEVAPALLDAAGAISSVGPAYQALLAEAQIDAGVRRGLPAALATRLVLGTMAGSAALISHRCGDTLAIRREVSSPGGSTARGLAALERGGVRAAFADAIDAVMGGSTAASEGAGR